MVPANELRLGNWVYHTSNRETADINDVKALLQKRLQLKVHVSSIEENMINGESNERFEPIRLNVRMIEKCGFVNGKLNIAETLYLAWQDERIVLNCGEQTTAYSIQYLHQLQNVYLALTGKEMPVIL